MNETTFQIWLLKENLKNAPELSSALNEIGEVTRFTRFDEMISYYKLKEEEPDIIISEYHLRTRNFVESMTQWKQPRFLEKVPTVMISTMDCPQTIRALFQSGLREYFIAPVSSTEVLIKTEQILRGQSQPAYASQYIRHGKKIIKGLTKKEIQIFSFFQSKKSNTATKEELKSYCWPNQSMTGQTLNVHIHNMRKKLYTHGLSIRGHKNGIWRLEEVKNVQPAPQTSE